MTDLDTRKDDVSNYYSEVLSSTDDLQTTACCTTEAMPSYLKPIASQIHPEVLSRFYGCGSPIPHSLTGKTVLDLGCGTGRDCFMISKLVGPSGKVIGIDMTEEQLEVARNQEVFHQELWGYERPNTDFRSGVIEDLKSVDLADNSVDVVISNCVINLSADKEKVFSEIFRVLKPGGELYFSDVFSDRRIPTELKNDKVMVGECLGGALYIEDFRRMLYQLGVPDYRIITTSKIDLKNEKLEQCAGNINFYSITIRAFKLDIEDRCEDYGQVAIYKGTIPESPNNFILDDHHNFETNRPMLVCSNTAAMVRDTRYQEHFEIIGDESQHFGLFDCAPVAGAVSQDSDDSLGGCC